MDLIPKTQLDQDLDGLLSSINTIALAAAATATTLNNAHAEFWRLPDERLAAVLNRIGAEKVQEMFDQHFALGSAANAFLDASEFSGPRAVTVRGREITLGADGLFTVVPLPNPE